MVLRLDVIILSLGLILTWRHFLHAFTSHVHRRRLVLVGLLGVKRMAGFCRCVGGLWWGDEGAKPLFHALLFLFAECCVCVYAGGPCVCCALSLMIL